MLGLEDGGLEADEASLKVNHDDSATLLPQRVLHDGHSTARFLLVISHHAAAGEPVIGDECEMTRLSLRVEW